MAKFNVKIFSDNVCPWCFVGKKNLEAAIKQYTAKESAAGSPPEFDVRWKPFFLSIDSPECSVEPVTEYLEKKYGQGAGARMSASLDKVGQANGIQFNHERKVHNTLRSHRLVRVADAQDKGNEMIGELFHGYFEEGKNIADAGVLLELAEKAGVECTKEYLEGSEGKEEVIGEYEKGTKTHGITGVPYFIVSREGNTATRPLSGGQAPESFIEAFEALSA